MNIYLRDAGFFIRESSRLISDSIEKPQAIQAIFNLALGIERVLKGILYNVNPVYVLMDPTFNNSLQALYKGKLINNTDGHTELNKNTNTDVITFKNSLLRAQAVSETTFNNKNLLFTIANARDIIAHNDLNLLEIDKLIKLLKRDYYQLISNYCFELNISRGKYFDGYQIKLSELSSKYSEDMGQKLELKYVAHRERWHMLQLTTGFKEMADKITEEILTSPGKSPIECPACSNTAVVYSKFIKEFNPFENKEIVVGSKVAELRCRYCKLDIKDYKELDYLKLDNQTMESE